ncbi:MAG: lytic transglycosylase domain-containing protein [Pseudaminobacter sp.]
MSGRLNDNSVVTPAVKKETVEEKKAETPRRNTVGERESSVKEKKPAATRNKTAGVKAKQPTKPKSVVMTSRKSGQKVALDMVQTASIGSKGAKTAKQSDPRYGKLVEQYAQSYGVPVSLAHAVISIESNYRVDARGSAGEIGLMQIKPSTARMMGYSGGSKGLFDPETNIKYGMKYLAKAHSLGGGTTCGTILKYNAGHAAKRMNPVSSAYCGKVLRHLAAN